MSLLSAIVMYELGKADSFQSTSQQFMVVSQAIKGDPWHVRFRVVVSFRVAESLCVGRANAGLLLTSRLLEVFEALLVLLLRKV